MQVRTFIIILISLQLTFSLTSLIYNIVNNRSIFSFYHFTTNSSQYFISKYRTNEWQIYALQLCWQIMVILTQISTLILLICLKIRQKKSQELCKEYQQSKWEFILIAVGVIGQTVVAGYNLEAILEIGYENGINNGDFIVAAFQGVIFGLMLITVAIYIYNFQTLQKTLKRQQMANHMSDIQHSPQVNLLKRSCKKQLGQQNAISGTVLPNMHHYKPNLNENTSPMNQHFQNLSHYVQPQNVISSARCPLLQMLPPQVQQKQQNKSISSINKSVKLKVHVPKLNLDQMKKKDNINKDPFTILSNLQISAIKPLRHSKASNNPTSVSEASNVLPKGKKQTKPK